MKYLVHPESSDLIVQAFTVRGDFVEFLMKNEFPHAKIVVNDLWYSMVDPQWFVGDFSDYYKKRISDIEYSVKFDCDDFTRTLLHELHLSHLKSKSKAESLFVGEVHFVSERDVLGNVVEAHAINVVVTLSGAAMGPHMFFYEPQTGEVVEMSEEELRSIFYIKF